MIQSTVIDQFKVPENESRDRFINDVIQDFWICCVSREVSLLGRREVLTGKAKFGILGDGKEVPQVALAKAIQNGDWRSGYYRDQTLMFALGLCSVEEFFAQLYADSENDPFSAGRQMNSHYATAMIDKNGEWLDQTEGFNVSSDISPTAGQMARGLGLAYASTIYKNREEVGDQHFSRKGNEVCVVTIGDASTSEGVFWETVNAACVTKSPLAICVWDDGYGISVPKKLQTTKGSISRISEGFLTDENGDGMDIYVGKAWDYPGLCEMFVRGIEKMREEHRPALFHIEECTQPQGHSTSGSHERYKSEDRLQWEKDYDCIDKMAEWMLEAGLVTDAKIEEIKSEAKKYARDKMKSAWSTYRHPQSSAEQEVKGFFDQASQQVDDPVVRALTEEYSKLLQPGLAEITQMARRLKYALLAYDVPVKTQVAEWIEAVMEQADQRYHTHLYASGRHSALQVPVIPPIYSSDKKVNGYQVLNKFFDTVMERDSRVHAFGEDVGYIGDVNQGFAGLQDKYGSKRVFDTGIREWTIMGQAIGMAMRGLRPIAEIQYLDYLIYGLEPLSDDLATLRWRSGGIQQAPAIIRTRGHRLEGIWHAGSPLGMIVNSLRGMWICVPRNMVQAAGMYNTLLQSQDPGLVIECLNGYRLKENLPDNLGTYTVPLGSPDVLAQGSDVTLVTYGSCVRIAQKAIGMLAQHDINVELIDVQTLIPFDLEHVIQASLKKTNRLVVLDEDFTGGGSAYILQKVLEEQGGYNWLDSAPLTISAGDNRPPFGSEGDYFSKPNEEDVFEGVYKIMHEADPKSYPALK